MQEVADTRMYETVKDFAKRTGLPYKVVMVMAKEEELPIIRSGRTIYVHIQNAMDIIEENSMRIVTDRRRVVISVTPEALKKFKGRYPDKVREAIKESSSSLSG